MSELLLAPSYLGQVATRCFMPRKLLAGAGRWMMTRSVHFMRDRAVNPVIGLANWLVETSLESTPGPGLVRVSIEYPAGTFTESDENIAAGSVPVAWPAGTSFFHFRVTIPNGAKFWVRVLQQNDNGVLFRQPQHDSLEPLADCAMEFGTGTPNDRTMGGEIAASAWTYHPVLILAKTRRPSILAFGDSREEGGSEGPRPPITTTACASARLPGISAMRAWRNRPPISPHSSMVRRRTAPSGWRLPPISAMC